MMGGKKSKERIEPVLGLAEENKLSVIPIFRTSLRDSYTLNRFTTLKLKKSRMYSVESNILDSRGFYFLRKSGSFLTNSLEFRDDAGNVVASLEKKTSCSISIAWIMLGSSPGPVVATLYHKYMGRRSKVHVYISNPPLHCQFIDNSDRNPDLLIAGDISSNTYSFLLGGKRKVAQVYHQKEGRGPQVFLAPELNMYTLEIGPYVDIAFIAICASAVDLLQLRSSVSILDNCLYCLSALEPDNSDDDEDNDDDDDDDDDDDLEETDAKEDDLEEVEEVEEEGENDVMINCRNVQL
ncbi:uncharacterized protein LOC111697614 isoform X2 [Eurytemora carolleeae]|uniref:uncharacterized protein LOC111697614 isoform X2 n=1 Tax=Eurytemora carolleeae TaxID=1294199 RepID=UPI000C76951D|nr:uncharacterized protein LOC111697614 isoform X2 [Eurytemora carolleeae]|eukprot:XP_023323452.1 uncharacterized protein LOC111697614 isoform X2 [Eurytemora affinis]